MSSGAHAEGSRPRGRLGVMVSSTYNDLSDLRQVLIEAALGAKLFPEAMEHDAARPVDLIESSVGMVRRTAAYALLIGHRYGQQPACDRNPKNLSITELEFDEAIRLDLPIVLIVLGDDYPMPPRHVDRESTLKARLDAFRARAKSADGSGSGVCRVYAEVNSPDEFRRAAERSLQRLAQDLAKSGPPPPPGTAATDGHEALPPRPPTPHAVPAYIGSHTFVGRDAELNGLDDWSAAEDAHPLLLFDAIGGSGKSMLAWHWFGTRAPARRGGWAGRFWYSFYEAGASMADCCRQALAYLTHRPVADWRERRAPDLARELLLCLRERPWLLVLDGLERILVAYHRCDAAIIADEALEKPTDQIADRNPCAAARPEDDELLRQLAFAAPSKILVTTRLVPQALLNASHQSIPGVRREPLRGLRPEDAAHLLRGAGVRGDAAAMQRYLQAHCDAHPLVVGALAGLIVDFGAGPGDFDAWERHADGGAALDLSALDLVGKRNHILRAALDAVPAAGRQLLGTLALLHDGVDREAIEALNPHRPPEPEAVDEPTKPEDERDWKYSDKKEKAAQQRQYAQRQAARAAYLRAHTDWLASPALKAARKQLAATLRDLQRRGLLQVGEGLQPHYDLHPVVRGVVSGALGADDTAQLGQRVVDHFSRRSHSPYEQAETLQDLVGGFHIVRTLLRMGRIQQASAAWFGDLAVAAHVNVQCYGETLALLQPFFPQGWLQPPMVDDPYRRYLMNSAAGALSRTGLHESAVHLFGVQVRLYAPHQDPRVLQTSLQNLSTGLLSANRLADSLACGALASRIGEASGLDDSLFSARFAAFRRAVTIGDWPRVQALWDTLDDLGRDWSREAYRPGDAEIWRARSLWWQGRSPEAPLDAAEALARRGKAQDVLRKVLALRGEWRLAESDAVAAIQAFDESARLARASGQPDLGTEIWLALARQQAGQLADLHAEAERLHAEAERLHVEAERVRAVGAAGWPLAKLWQAAGDLARAREEALKTHHRAWADGEPYVRRFELDRARALLEELGEPIPHLPPYDPAHHPRFDWQDKIEAAIIALEARKLERDAGVARRKADPHDQR